MPMVLLFAAVGSLATTELALNTPLIRRRPTLTPLILADNRPRQKYCKQGDLYTTCPMLEAGLTVGCTAMQAMQSRGRIVVPREELSQRRRRRQCLRMHRNLRSLRIDSVLQPRISMPRYWALGLEVVAK
ncbi:hypothetical protein EDB86DRAFT_1288206 [Lactarius hatsudake]|nr:hypothetical protein EDB86DRAFT_1288206 [Lactarius hatsudake]